MKFILSLKSRMFRLLNIDIQPNQGPLLVSSLISGLIYAFTCAPIQKEVISKLPAEYISVEALWFCLSALIIGAIWKGRTREIILKNFIKLALIESIGACAIAFYLVFVQYNIWLFAISTMLYGSIIMTFVGKCIMMFESRMWKNKQREMFDNTSSVVRNVTAVLGFGLATFCMPSLKVAILLWGIGCIFDDIGWIIIYRRKREFIMNSVSPEV